MQYIGSSEAAKKTYFCENLFIKSAHFCKDLADLYGSSRFSATIFAEPCRSAQIRKDRKPGEFQSVFLMSCQFGRCEFDSFEA